MCNVHDKAPKEDFGPYVRRHMREIMPPDDEATKPAGPFGTGPFVVPSGDDLKGVLGQCKLIRPVQPVTATAPRHHVVFAGAIGAIAALG